MWFVLQRADGLREIVLGVRQHDQVRMFGLRFLSRGLVFNRHRDQAQVSTLKLRVRPFELPELDQATRSPPTAE